MGPTHSGEARRTAHSQSAPFSPADLALVELIAEGLDDAAIGAKLGLTTSAAKGRIKRLMQHRGAGGRAGLVGQACGAGQLGPPHGLSGYLPRRLSEVLPGIAAGQTNGEIAAALHLSVDAIKARNADLYEHLGVNSRAHAVLIAYRAGLLPEAER